jgi:methyl-accepting chemotaxis protein
MTNMPQYNMRRIILINPRFQLRVAMLFCAIILLGGGLLAFQIFRDARDVLVEATARGHFENDLTPFMIVSRVIVRDLLVVAGGLLVATFALFGVLLRRIHSGILRLVEVLVKSAEGDLSTKTDAPGPVEVGAFGERLDGIRAKTLVLVNEIRADAAALESGSLPPAEFDARWEALKEKLGRLAP